MVPLGILVAATRLLRRVPCSIRRRAGDPQSRRARPARRRDDDARHRRRRARHDAAFALALSPPRKRCKPGATDKQATFDVTLAADVDPATTTCASLTDDGVSLPVVIGVDRLPQRPLAAVPVRAAGRPARRRRRQHRRRDASFMGKAGQKVLVEVEAQRLGSKLRPVVHLLQSEAAATRLGLGDARAVRRCPAGGDVAGGRHVHRDAARCRVRGDRARLLSPEDRPVVVRRSGLPAGRRQGPCRRPSSCSARRRRRASSCPHRRHPGRCRSPGPKAGALERAASVRRGQPSCRIRRAAPLRPRCRSCRPGRSASAADCSRRSKKIAIASPSRRGASCGWKCSPSASARRWTSPWSCATRKATDLARRRGQSGHARSDAGIRRARQGDGDHRRRRRCPGARRAARRLSPRRRSATDSAAQADFRLLTPAQTRGAAGRRPQRACRSWSSAAATRGASSCQPTDCRRGEAGGRRRFPKGGRHAGHGPARRRRRRCRHHAPGAAAAPTARSGPSLIKGHPLERLQPWLATEIAVGADDREGERFPGRLARPARRRRAGPGHEAGAAGQGDEAGRQHARSG